MKWLNYHHLFYFHAIAKEGGVAKAARALKIGQPALSTQLKQFEAQLGYALFERKKQTLALTERGQVVFEYASEIFRLGHEMIEAAEDRLSAQRVHLQVGALDSLPKALVHKLVEAAYSIGNCYVTVLEGSGERLFKELKAHRVDLVLTDSSVPVGLGQQLYSKLVADMPVVICGAPGHAHLSARFPQSLAGQPFILPTSDSKLRQDVDHYFSALGVDISAIGETQDSEVQKLLALSGRALIPIALPAVKENLKEKRLVKIGTLGNVSEQLWLTAAQRRIENPVAAELMKSFKVG